MDCLTPEKSVEEFFIGDVGDCEGDCLPNAAGEKRKQDEILHPFIEEKVMIGQLFYIQALLMNRYMRNDLDGYPAFFWR